MKRIALAAVALIALVTAAPHGAFAGPFLSWAQTAVAGDRISCRDRAVSVIRKAREWQVRTGRQSAEAQDDELSVWIRCWELPGGTQSVLTIVVAAKGPSDAARDMRTFIYNAMRRTN